MQALLLRVKNNLRIFEEEDELIFTGSYGKAAVVKKSELVFQLLKQLTISPQRDKLITALAGYFSVSEELIAELIERFITTGVLEYYTITGISSITYRRYETQLAFLDLMQPVNAVSEKLERHRTLNQLHVMILGIGGIGNYAALSFVAMGTGRVTLVDGDLVELSNLNRQVLFNENNLGHPKAAVAQKKLQALNSDTVVKGIPLMIADRQQLHQLLEAEGVPDLIFISADTPQLPLWVDEMAKRFRFTYVKSSYQGLTGFIGPLIEPHSVDYSSLVAIEKETANSILQVYTAQHKHASCSPMNAIVANLAVLECLKYLLGFQDVMIRNRRLYFDAGSLQTYFEDE